MYLSSRKQKLLVGAVLLFIACFIIFPLWYKFTRHFLPNSSQVLSIKPSNSKSLFANYYTQHNVDQFTRSRYQDSDFNYTKITYNYIHSPSLETISKQNTIAILSTIGNGNSYGENRQISDLFDTIQSFMYENSLISLSLLVGDLVEFEKVDKFFHQYFKDVTTSTNQQQVLRKVTLVTAPFIELLFNSEDRANRHSDRVQRLRRRQIARSRNFNLLHGLDTEKYTLFIDADITHINHSQMLQLFIKSGADIVVPRIQRGDNPDYDKNSWRGQRTKPNDHQLKQMDNNDWDNWDYVPRDAEIFHFQNFVDDTSKSPEAHDLSLKVPLDSVGGGILFAKLIVYKQGAIFPPIYIIGTSWDRNEGYDGIETEGLCYVAKSLGYKCWGMPNLLAQHDPHGYN